MTRPQSVGLKSSDDRGEKRHHGKIIERQDSCASGQKKILPSDLFRITAVNPMQNESAQHEEQIHSITRPIKWPQQELIKAMGNSRLGTKMGHEHTKSSDAPKSGMWSKNGSFALN